MKDLASNFEIQGHVEVPDGVTFDAFCNKFSECMKILGWRFTGIFENMLIDQGNFVKVIRCKNCIHWEATTANQWPKYGGLATGWCGLLEQATDDNFYCQQAVNTDETEKEDE